MELLSPSSMAAAPPHNRCRFLSPLPPPLSSSSPPRRLTVFSFRALASLRCSSSSLLANASSELSERRSRWMVIMEKPPRFVSSKYEVIDYFVGTLARVLGSEKDAQMCIYDASWQSNYGFCCDIDEGDSQELSRMPGVFMVRPDKDHEFEDKDYSCSNLLLDHVSKSNSRVFRFTPSKDNEYWLVKLGKPGFEVITKAQMVDYYVEILAKVTGNEKDAQMCMYHISWEKDLGFCCQIGEDWAQELADVPGVLSVQPDTSFGFEDKNYKGGDGMFALTGETQMPEVKTKRLFVTGLSFYTSEKTLRAAFEGFGELVEVKVIMDRISKRSKGYAFLEYTTEEAAAAALKEMNGKIINGWMIVVDVARANPPNYGRGNQRLST